MTRPGDWNCTVTGGQFWPLDPRAEEVDIRDIAHALSNVCRYAGHTTEFYSVAQHSVLVADLLAGVDGVLNMQDRATVLTGLLHDGAEAYIGDMTRPLKRCAPMGSMFCAIEETIYSVIAQKFGARDPLPVIVKHADDVLLVTEVRDLHPRLNDQPWHAPPVKPLERRIQPWAPSYARDQFLDRFHRICAL